MLFIPLLFSLVLADAAGFPPEAGEATLHVPYLNQTEALCGGAAAAMLFRYWGERHAGVQQFEPLVDHRAGGIADDVLERAIRERHWITRRVDGSVATIRSHLAAGQPLMLLIEDRPRRYHYVVVVAADDQAVYVHDPAWGPSRRLTFPGLERAWKATGYWALLVLPDPARQPPQSAAAPAVAAAAAAARAAVKPMAECDRLVDTALDEISAKGQDAADVLLGEVRSRCPQSSRPLAELAGVRFSERRTTEAAALADQAVKLNPRDLYAWDVLGSSRFVANDLDGALEAWNHAGKPSVDALNIDGLVHTRYALVAGILELTPDDVLTASDFRLAERRLQQLPDRLSSRIAYRPDADGYATVDIVVVERPRRPRGLMQWAAATTQALIDREVKAVIPGGTGQGEVWSAGWRWWRDRPRLAFAFAAPRSGRVPGVWQVDGSWEAQTYSVEQVSLRETRTHAGVGFGNWLAPGLRYQAGAGLDDWDHSNRAVSINGALEQRLFDDHVSLIASAGQWTSVSNRPAFRNGSAAVQLRSSRQTDRFVVLGSARFDAVSAAAPMALWPGAGEGRARTGLLRAHPLLRDNIIAGPVFGRRVFSVNAEGQRWFARPALLRLGAAVFVDAASAAHRLAGTAGQASQIDAGIGARLVLPGGDGTLRIDYARGLRDGADAVTVGWQLPW